MGSGGGPWSAILPKMLRRRPTPSGAENPPDPAPGAPDGPKPDMLILNPPSGIPIPPAGPPPIGPDPYWSPIPAPMTLIRRRRSMLIAGLTTC